MSGFEDCGNCGRRIGKLEQASLWNEHVVCVDCWQALTRAAAANAHAQRSLHAAAGAAGSFPDQRPDPSAAVGAPPIPPVVPWPQAMTPPPASTLRTIEPFTTGLPVPAPDPRPLAPALAIGPGLTCSRCGGSFPLSEVSDDGERVVCSACGMADAARSNGSRGRRRRRGSGVLTLAGAGLSLAAVAVAAFYAYDRVTDGRAKTELSRVDAAAATEGDDGMGGRLFELMLEGAALEAAGKTREAQAQYHAVAKAIATVAAPSPAQQKLAARATEAVQRLDAGLPDTRGPRPKSIFSDDGPPLPGRAGDAAAMASSNEAANGLASDATAGAPAVSGSRRNAGRRTAAAGARLAQSFVDELGGNELPSRPSPSERGRTERVGGADNPELAGGAFPDGSARPEMLPGGDDGTGYPPSTADDPSAAMPPMFDGREGAPKTGKQRRPVAARRGPSGLGAEIDRGRDALAVGQYQAALDAFKDVLAVEKKSPHAHHGLGLAYLGLGQSAKAVESLEKAAQCGTNRAIVHNLAVVHMKGNPMRSAKFVRDFLALPTTPLDEPLQNLLGTAMVSANDAARSGTMFVETRNFYMEYDRRLAVARRDGNKRWGANWIRAEDADQRWAKAKAAAEELSRLSRDAGRASVRTKKAYQAVRDIATSFRLHSEMEKRSASARYRNAIESEKAVREKLEQARTTASYTEQPPFPAHYDVIPIDALDPARHPR